MSLDYEMAHRSSAKSKHSHSDEFDEAKSKHSHSDEFDEVYALFEMDLTSMLMLDYPDYSFITADKNEETFNALRLIVGGGFPNTNWITVAYCIENYSESDGTEGNYESLTFGCVYRANVVKGSAIYHVGTYYIDNSCLIDLEKDFRYHDDDLKKYVDRLDRFIIKSRETVKIRKEYIKEFIQNEVEIVPYATAKISQLNYLKSKVTLMRKLKRAQDLISMKKRRDPVDDNDAVIILNLRSKLAAAEQKMQLAADDLKKNAASLTMDEYKAQIEKLRNYLKEKKIQEDKMKMNFDGINSPYLSLEARIGNISRQRTGLLDTISKHAADDRIAKNQLE